jgi:hypothetical protein
MSSNQMFSWIYYFERFTVATVTCCLLRNVCVTNDHGWVSFVVIIIQPFPHSRLITGFVTRVTRWVPHADQELLTLLEHPIFCVKFVLLDFEFSVWCFVHHCLSVCSFSIGHCIVCPSSIYGFWLPILYLQIFLQR